MSDENELPPELKNDLELSFNMLKNENNKINKLKLRTLLFSFVMYKSSAADINEYIESQTDPDQELFSFDDVCDMVNYKLEQAKNKEADELFNYINGNKLESDYIKESDLKKAFKNYEIEVSDKEIKEMIKYMLQSNNNDVENQGESMDEERKANGEEVAKEEFDEKNASVNTLNKVNREQFKRFYTDKK